MLFKSREMQPQGDLMGLLRDLLAESSIKLACLRPRQKSSPLEDLASFKWWLMALLAKL